MIKISRGVWLEFTIGFVVIAALAMLWFRSLHTNDAATIASGAATFIEFTSQNGSLHATFAWDLPVPFATESGIQSWTRDPDQEVQPFGFFDLRNYDGGFSIVIPHWLPILAFCTYLGWRVYRLR